MTRAHGERLSDIAARTRAWACYDCGKCSATCPVTRIGGALSPRRTVLSTNLLHADVAVYGAEIASCLTCGACDRRCPVQVDFTGLVRALREVSHEEDAQPECPHGGALQSLMRMMARGTLQQQRLDWLGPDLHTDPAHGAVFLWTGCTVYYDAFFPEYGMRTLDVTRAAVRLLNALGQVPVVSPDEVCCGHDLLWNGDRASFEALARRNAALIQESGAEVVVAPCAECARTLRLDYGPFLGSSPRIQHLSEYLAERLSDLPLVRETTRRVTFQDPCRLGRHLGVVDAPRSLLAAVPGLELVEMAHAGLNATCCAGGTWSACDRYAKKLQVERLKEAKATGAEILVTACPKCQIHFRCAQKDPNLGQDIAIEMQDVAQVLADAL
ncbi:MAG: (Fe-S)-binding protein [Deltaproteobacteria bacterium]|nr:(Fe-S)-binding protein [Deltaproteobacteria bacterium]